MNAAASQAASLAGLHPASWWSMAQLAAQDYFSRLQASGLSAFSHPADLAAAFPGGLAGMTAAAAAAANTATGSTTASGSLRQNNGESKGKGRKEKKSSNSGSGNNNNGGHNSSALNNSSSGGLNLNAGTSSSPSSYKVSTTSVIQ